MNDEVFYVDPENIISYPIRWISSWRIALIEDIKKNGITVPVKVIPIGNGKYILHDGGHRVELAKKYGMKVPCVIYHGK